MATEARTKPSPSTRGGDARDRLLAGMPVMERRLQLAGISTAVLEGGAGPPMVLLHGPGAYAAAWLRVIPGLVTTHRVVAPDLPGHGSSTVDAGELDASRVMTWLAELIEVTCPSPPVVVGHLMGGAIAAHFASNDGRRLSRLVLVDTLGLAPFDPSPEFGSALTGFLEQPTADSFDALWRQCSFDLDGLREQLATRWDAITDYTLELATAPAVAQASSKLMELFAMPAIPDEILERIAVPTTLIWGRHDRATPLRVGEEASGRYGWPLSVIEKAADDPTVDQPEAFLHALRSALHGGGVMASATTTDSIRALRESFAGLVLEPDDGGYDEARRIHNGLIDRHPAVIARCLQTADVVAAVEFARDEGLEISVRGGGHNVAGKAVNEGGLMIDLSLMKGIHVDPARRTVRAQPGVTVRELDRANAVFGLATPSGVVSSTGIAGLTLGGGIAWLQGKYGLAVDNLLSAEVVLASGDVVTTSDDLEPELFWALRGGGGNFGVVTSFEFRAHPLVSVLGGAMAYPLEEAPKIFAFFRDFSSDLPDELSLQAGFIHAPDGSGTKLCAIIVCHAGLDPERAAVDMQPLRELGTPVVDMVQRFPYQLMNTGADWLFSKGALNYWKSAFFSELSDGAVEVMIDAFERAPSERCMLAVEEFHGAVTRVPHDATAYPHREPGFNLLLISQWASPDDTEAGKAWARETFHDLAPFMADRSYTNYLTADDHDRLRQAFGPNYDRLVDIKAHYDPENRFRGNQNIVPNG
jgi:FAD/FMN-containing dehydrogenase/pimeloyl-ACP methyl ester carboxylesterase